MFLPQGTEVWKNLKSSFVNIDNLLLYLKNIDFSGYIHFQYSYQEGMIILQEGDMVGGLLEKRDSRRCGPKAIKAVLEMVRSQRKASFTIYRLPRKTVAVLSGAYRFSTRVIFKNLSSGFSNLDRFIAKAKKDTFTGYIDIHFSNERNSGMIVIQKGKIEAILLDDIQIGPMEDAGDYLTAANLRISQKAELEGVNFDVYALA